jgi:hypothetical protein
MNGKSYFFFGGGGGGGVWRAQTSIVPLERLTN